VTVAFEHLGDVAGADDDDRLLISADLLVGLPPYVAGGDEDAELPVAQPGDQPAGVLYASTASAWLVALGL
jgi:hypothetical protein